MTSKLSFQYFFFSRCNLAIFFVSVVAESESLSGVLYDSDSSSAPSFRLVFCAARSLPLSATVLLILRLLMLFELELVAGFLGERTAVVVEGEFVEHLLLYFY